MLINFFWGIYYYSFLWKKKVRRIEFFKFNEWHHSTIYFSGFLNNQKVFIKCSTNFQTHLDNEIKIINRLSINNAFFTPTILINYYSRFGNVIVYKFIDGLLLDDYLKVNNNIKIGKKLIAAINLFYDLKIIHRDLKPNNIFISQNDLIIIDYAFSVDKSKLTPKFPDTIEIGLGEQYKPQTYLWDDAFSLWKIFKEYNFSKEDTNEIKNKIGQLTFRRIKSSIK